MAKTTKNDENMADKTAKLIEKSVYTALGAIAITYDATADMIKDLIERGKVAPDEGKRFIEDLSKRINKEKENIKKRAGDGLQGSAENMGIATKKDIEKLNNSIEQLTNRIALLEAKEVSKHTHPTTEI